MPDNLSALLESEAFRLYGLTSAILALHLIALALWTAGARGLGKKYVNPEDSAAFRGERATMDTEAVLRAKRAHQNALESALPFFVVGLLYVLTGGSKLGAQAYFFTFVGARILHSVFYLAGKQPWRTLMWVIGIAAIVGMAVHVLRAVI